MHLESLDDRSRPNHWNIRPHAHADLNHLFAIQRGGGEMKVERGPLAFAAPAVLLVPARTIHAFHWEPESAGWVLTLSASYLDDLAAQEIGFRALFEKPDCFEAAANDAMTALFEFQMARLSRELAGTAPGRAAAIQSHLLAVLVEAMRLMDRQRRSAGMLPGPQAEIVARFRAVIDEHYRYNLSLAAYADRLGVSASRLRAASLRIAGQPPLRLIQERRLLEARRLLLHSNATIADVAYRLGYDDAAYFSRLFTRHIGQSPRAFRKARTS